MPQLRSSSTIVLAVSALATPIPGLADISAAVTLTSDYIWRGISKSGGDLALQANLDYQHDSGAYAGAFLSSVNFEQGYGSRYYGPRDSTDLEAIPYIGYSFAPMTDWRLEAQWSVYVYDDDLFGQASNYHEGYAFVHFRDLVTAEFAWAPDAYGQGESTFNGQVTGRYPVTASANVSAGGGYFDAADVLGYDFVHWHVGATWYHRYGGVDVRYFGSRERDPTATAAGYYPGPADGELVISVTFGF